MNKLYVVGIGPTNAGWNEYIVLFGTMAVNLTTEFLYDRFFVFRGTMNTNKRAQKEREHASEEVEGDE